MEKSVAILLCTYNGSRFLRQQLDSFINQIHKNWVVFASDDGSADDTLQILQEYQTVLGNDKLKILNGPNKGFAWNFISLLEQASREFDYYAFSDQDDEWMQNKLSHAINYLENKNNLPSIYCGRTILIDENGTVLGLSPLFNKKPSFRNALVQSIAGGNTMLINNNAHQIIIDTLKWKTIVSHDWWIYILITGCGGNVYYDATPTLKYRQHQQNIIGSNISFSARFIRIKKLMNGHFKKWNDENIELLKYFEKYLTIENKIIFENFSKGRNENIFLRIMMLLKTRLYRQTLFGNIALVAAVILKKI